MAEYEKATSPTDSLLDNEVSSPRIDKQFSFDETSEKSDIIFSNINCTVEVRKGCCKTASKLVLKNCR